MSEQIHPRIPCLMVFPLRHRLVFRVYGSRARAGARAGYHVITAADGEEGLGLARENKPDLVILDLMLPKLPGRAVLRELRSRPETAIHTCDDRKQPPSEQRQEAHGRRRNFILREGRINAG